MTFADFTELLSSARAASIAATLAAIVSVVAGIRAMLMNSDAAQLQKKQAAVVKIVAARALVCWEQLETFVAAEMGGYIVDSYLIPSAVHAVKRLEESLDEALGIGLFNYIAVPGRYGMAYYTAFGQSLDYLATSPLNNLNDSAEWTKQHYLFGLARLLDRCISYPRPVFEKELEQHVRSRINTVLEEAQTYLQSKEIV